MPFPAPSGPPATKYAQLRAALAAARSGAKPPKVAGQTSFERLLRAIGPGNLKVVKA